MNDAAIISYIVSRWMGWAILSFLLGVLFLISSFCSEAKKYRWWLLIALLLYTVIYAVIPTFRGIMDISQQSYISETVTYHRSSQKYSNNFTELEKIEIILSDGQTLILTGATSEFPYGEFVGTITYSERSKVAISFIPD